MGKHKKHKRNSHEPTGGHEMRVVFQLSTEPAHPTQAAKHPSQGVPHHKVSSKHLPRETLVGHQGASRDQRSPHETFHHEQPLSGLPVSIHLDRLKKPEVTESALEHKHPKHKKHKKHKKHHHHDAVPREQAVSGSVVSPPVDQVQAPPPVGPSHEQLYKHRHHHKQHKKVHSFDLSSELSKQEGSSQHSRPHEHTRPQHDIKQEHTRPQLQEHTRPHLQEHTRPHLQEHTRPHLQEHTRPHLQEHTRPHLQEHTRPHLQEHTRPHLQEHTKPQHDIKREHTRPQHDIKREHTRPQLYEHTRPQLYEHTRPQLHEHTVPQLDKHTIPKAEPDVHEIFPSPPSPSTLPQEGHKSHHKKKKKKHKHHHRVTPLEPGDDLTPSAKHHHRVTPLEPGDDLTPSAKRPRIEEPRSTEPRPSHGEKHISQKQYVVPRLTTQDATATPRQDITATPRQDITATPRQDITVTPRQDITATPRQDITATPRQDITATPRQDITATPRQDITATPRQDITVTPRQESHAHLSVPHTQKIPQVKLSKSALKFFLKNLIHQIQRRDPQRIFAEPVADDIAPGYSQIIKYPMDLATIAWKIESSQYPSVNEFKEDFVLMCNNAMTYNAPETSYYATAKNLLTAGLKIVAKETSMRPDIRHGKLSGATRSNTTSPLPEFLLPPPTSVQLDYTSPYICRLDLNTLRPSDPSRDATPILESHLDVIGGGVETDQSHLTRVCVGVEDDVSDEEPPDDLVMQVKEAGEEVKENLDANRPDSRFCFINRNQDGKTMLNILNPDSGEIDSAHPVDHSAMTRKIQIGSHAGNVLKTELNLLKATPVTYLMYGPFGSFAPTIDSSFATLQKMDSEMLLSSYGSELGVSYAHSLQQFVKGTPSFVTEMADAVLNGLTYNRHGKFKEAFQSFQENERLKKELQKVEKKDLTSSLPSPPELTGEPSSVAQEAAGDRFGSAPQQTTSIDAKLMQTSELISELHDHQSERLSQPPEKSDDGHLILPGPSTQETEIASSLTQELTALTSQVQPQNVVSVPLLRKAMGITESLPDSRTIESSPDSV